MECSDLDQHKYSMRQAMEQLMAERNNLIDRVTAVSRRFDDTVREITEERRLMEIQNARHAKYVTTKVILNILHQTHQTRLLQGFQEIVSYTNFDSKCNTKLKTLANLLEKAGATKLRLAMNHWFSCALKPVESKIQSEALSQLGSDHQLRARCFLQWRNLF